MRACPSCPTSRALIHCRSETMRAARNTHHPQKNRFIKCGGCLRGSHARSFYERSHVTRCAWGPPVWHQMPTAMLGGSLLNICGQRCELQRRAPLRTHAIHAWQHSTNTPSLINYFMKSRLLGDAIGPHHVFFLYALVNTQHKHGVGLSDPVVCWDSRTRTERGLSPLRLPQLKPINRPRRA